MYIDKKIYFIVTDQRRNNYPISFMFLSVFYFYFSFPIFAQDSLPIHQVKKIEINGFVKNMQSVFFAKDANSLLAGNLIHNRVNVRCKLFKNMHIRLGSRNRIFYGEQVKAMPSFSEKLSQDEGYLNLTGNLISDTGLILNTSLDRALLNWYGKKWDLSIGRQRINWGMGLVWNPNDIFNAFNYFDFDYEERPGSDAVRIQYFTGNFSSLQLALKFNKTINERVAALLFKTNIYHYDIQFFSGIYKRDVVIGSGWAGNLGEASFKGEASFFKPINFIDSTGNLSATFSFERSFKSDLYCVLSYLYTSNGKDIGNNFNDLMNVNLSAKNLMPFKHTIFSQISKTLNSLLNANLSFVFSPTEYSLLIFPTLNLSINNNWDLSLVVQSYFAEQQTTFSSDRNAIFLRLKWSY